MKRFICHLICCTILIFNCSTLQAATDSISREERMSALFDRVKNIPLLESALDFDYGDVKLTTDSIPESTDLMEKYVTGIVLFFEQDYDQFNDILKSAV